MTQPGYRLLGATMVDLSSIAKFVLRYPALGLSVFLLALGFVYLFNLEHFLIVVTGPIDQLLVATGIDLHIFGSVSLGAGALLGSVYIFFALTDLQKSHLSGLYYSSVTYNYSDIVRIIRTELCLSERELKQANVYSIDSPDHDDQVVRCMTNLDKAVTKSVKLGRGRKPLHLFGGVKDNLETSLSLHVDFSQPDKSNPNFVFKGFGIIVDKYGSVTSECGLVMPVSKFIASNNILQVRGLRQRWQLIRTGIVASIEMQQIIDPFEKHPEFRFMLKFKIKRALWGWKVSEGVYFTWDIELRQFVATACTGDIAISR